jgi:phosphate transport system substrate-binding protein
MTMVRSLLRWFPSLFAIAVAGALAGCNRDRGLGETPGAEGMAWWAGKITIDGSSTVLPLSMAIGEAFHKTNPAFQLSVESSGTAGGFRKLCAGKLTVANASRPINAAEAARCQAEGVEYVELPIAFDSLSVVVSSKNAFVDCLKTSELKGIWEPSAEAKVKQWNQVRPDFPAQPLALFGPGKDSGTFDYFTLAIVGTESSSRADYTASEDDTVIERGVAESPNALGYFGYAYYVANSQELKLVKVDSGKGCVAPSPDAVADGSYQPLSRPLFMYVNLAVATRPEVRAFTRFMLAPENARYISKLGYVPLPPPTLKAQVSRFENRVKGSVLGSRGSVTGVKLDSFSE